MQLRHRAVNFRLSKHLQKSRKHLGVTEVVKQSARVRRPTQRKDLNQHGSVGDVPLREMGKLVHEEGALKHLGEVGAEVRAGTELGVELLYDLKAFADH